MIRLFFETNKASFFFSHHVEKIPTISFNHNTLDSMTLNHLEDLDHAEIRQELSSFPKTFGNRETCIQYLTKTLGILIDYACPHLSGKELTQDYLSDIINTGKSQYLLKTGIKLTEPVNFYELHHYLPHVSYEKRKEFGITSTKLTIPDENSPLPIIWAVESDTEKCLILPLRAQEDLIDSLAFFPKKYAAFAQLLRENFRANYRPEAPLENFLATQKERIKTTPKEVQYIRFHAPLTINPWQVLSELRGHFSSIIQMQSSEDSLITEYQDPIQESENYSQTVLSLISSEDQPNAYIAISSCLPFDVLKFILSQVIDSNVLSNMGFTDLNYSYEHIQQISSNRSEEDMLAKRYLFGKPHMPTAKLSDLPNETGLPELPIAENNYTNATLFYYFYGKGLLKDHWSLVNSQNNKHTALVKDLSISIALCMVSHTQTPTTAVIVNALMFSKEKTLEVLNSMRKAIDEHGAALYLYGGYNNYTDLMACLMAVHQFLIENPKCTFLGADVCNKPHTMQLAFDTQKRMFSGNPITQKTKKEPNDLDLMPGPPLKKPSLTIQSFFSKTQEEPLPERELPAHISFHNASSH